MEAGVRPLNGAGPGPSPVDLLEHPFAVTTAVTPSDPPASNLVATSHPEPLHGQDTSSSTTIPRLASINGFTDNRDEPQRWGTLRQEDSQPDMGVSGAATGRSSDSVPLPGVDSLGDQEVVVLTPSRLRLDSRVVLAHATLQWLTNAVWAVLIWQKLEGRLSWSWWGVFSPAILNHALHLPLQLGVLLAADSFIHKQIGPPPPASASPGLVLQYAIIRAVRLRSHRVDWCNGALESAATGVVKLLFCDALQRGRLASTSLRLMFTPIWACWGVSVLLLCFKDRSERMFGSTRDLLFIFLLFVAFKVDEQSSYSWRVVFLVPWMWFSGLLLVATLVLLLLLFARCWSRPRELLLPLGFCALLLASLPQFMSYIALVRRLDGDSSTSYRSILAPNALSWLLMWLSSLLVAAALRAKEAVREGLLARGAVWTAHEAVARRLHAEREEARRRVEQLSDEEVSRLVASMMAGKSKPGRLRRVGATLYKRIASLEPALRGGGEVQLPSLSGAPGSLSTRPGTGKGNRVAPAPAAAAAGGAQEVPPGQPPASAASTAAAGPLPSLAAPTTAPGSSVRSGRWLLDLSADGAAAGAAGAGEAAATAAAGAAGGLSGSEGREADLDVERGGGSFRPAPRLASDHPQHPPPPPNPPAPALLPEVQLASCGSPRGGSAAPHPHPSPPSLSSRSSGPYRGAPPCTSASTPGVGGAPQQSGVLPLQPAAPAAAASSQPAAAAGWGEGDALQPAAAGSPRGGGRGGWGPADGPSAAAADSSGGSAAGREGPYPPGLDSPRGAGAGQEQGQQPGGASGGGGSSQLPPPPAAAAAASLPHLRTASSSSSSSCRSSSSKRAPAVLLPEAAGGGVGGQPEVEVQAEVQEEEEETATAAEHPGGIGQQQQPADSDAAPSSSTAPPSAPASAPAAPACRPPSPPDPDDGSCVICYDAAASCVFLECGHGGFCRRCAYRLFVRPPNECPTCRAPIEQVVEVEEEAP
ncbi:hypothetical protein Agub_g6064, partial [Astrephomene gubernaculifera]